VTLQWIALLLVIACLCCVVFLLVRRNRRYVQQSKTAQEEVNELMEMVKCLHDESGKGIEGKIPPTTDPFPIGENYARTKPREMTDTHTTGDVLIALGKISSTLGKFSSGDDDIVHSEDNLEIGHQESAL